MTDFHLDQHYGTAGPLGEFDYVGYYDYATCWNTSNTAKLAFHQLFGILGARFATGLGSAPATRPWHWSPLPRTSWPRTSLLILARLARSSTAQLYMILFKTFCSQVRFVLWTGDDTVHCDDAYSSKDTVGGLSFR